MTRNDVMLYNRTVDFMKLDLSLYFDIIVESIIIITYLKHY